MRFDVKKSFFVVITGVIFLSSGTVFAEYKSDAKDTGIKRLDYIENQHRIERESRLTEEQQQLRQDAAEMRAKRKTPIDPNKPSPATFEGDELFYDMKTGDAFAKGHVRVTQEEGRRLLADEAKGNLKTHDVYIEERTNLLQLVPNKTRVRLEGFRTEYNYDKKTGKMFNAAGKAGNHYIKAHKIEFYPDRIILYQGTSTKCGAKKPDYHMKAERIEVFPEDIMILYDVDFYLGGMHLYHKDRFTVDISGATVISQLPRAGYDSDNGWWIEQGITTPIAKKLKAETTLKYLKKHGVRNHNEFIWENAGNEAELDYGFYQDDDDRWMKKEPSFRYTYGHAIDKTAFSFNINGEIGRWNQVTKNKNGSITTRRSIHKYYSLGISHRPITFWKGMSLSLSGSYGVTKENYQGNSTAKGFSYSALFMQEFSPNVAAYIGYSYSAINSTNTVFSYDLDSYSKKLEYGISFRVSDRDRFVIGQYYDVETRRQRKIEYYWFHDMHCAQLIFRYRIDRDRMKDNTHDWHVALQFTPW